MNKEKYLRRIGVEDLPNGNALDILKRLQKQHLLNVPFENLDIHSGTKIILDVGLFYRKIVENNRGGFCYELNSGFNELLRSLGFETRTISARAAKGDGDFGPEFDHMALIVKADRSEYLSDVGFGDFTAGPLKLEIELEQDDLNGKFKISEFYEEYLEVKKLNETEWKSVYIFKPAARSLEEYSGMCEFHQTSPESHFTKGRLCSVMTESGRKTLTDSLFIETANGEKNEVAVGSEAEFEEILAREFSIFRNA